MELSIPALRDRLDSFLFELGGIHYRFGSGLTTDFPIQQLYAHYPELTRKDTFLQVREAADDARTDAGERRRLRRLLEFLAGQMEDAMAAESVEAASELEAAGTVDMNHEPIPFLTALAQLPREERRERRAGLGRALGDFLWEHRSVYARRTEAAARTAETLGYGSYLELREKMTGIDATALAADCKAVLAETEDAYRDLLGYVLKKLEPSLRAWPSGEGHRHDLQHAANAPWMAQHFRREELLPAVSRWLSDVGLHPNAEGRILLDTEDRPTKNPRAFVVDLRVPDDIRLVVRPGGGLDDYYSLLHEYGHAQHLAGVLRNLPVEDRRLGDTSVTEAYASLFDHFLLDEAWHRRYLRLPQSTAREAARMAAFNNLFLLRRYAAKLPYELELYQRGPSEARADEYAERQSQALAVAVHRGFYLYDVDPQLYAVRYLRAWALEARLHSVLQTRFDQDFWRNPAAGHWLRELFSGGQRDDASALAERLGGGPLSLLEAGKRLVRVMAA
jgi:hypothetical protein